MSRHQICHAHCRCSGAGGVAALALLVVVAIIAASARAVVHAAELVLEVAAIGAMSLAVLGVTGTVAYTALRARSSQARDLQTILFYLRHGPLGHARVSHALSAAPSRDPGPAAEPGRPQGAPRGRGPAA